MKQLLDIPKVPAGTTAGHSKTFSKKTDAKSMLIPKPGHGE